MGDHPAADQVTQTVVNVEEELSNDSPAHSSPAPSQPNNASTSEIAAEVEQAATRPSTSDVDDEVTAGNSSNAAGEPRQGKPKAPRTTSLKAKVIKGGPYTDLQLLWFRKKNAWPPRDKPPSRTVVWPPSEEHDVEELVRLADEFWSSEQKDRLKRLDSLSADASSGRNELYQVVGLYAVFLSVFFSSASQTNNLECHDWPILVLLTLVVTGFTLVIFYNKSRLNHALRDEITDLNQKYKHIESQIKGLRELGPLFGFEGKDLDSIVSSIDYDKIFGLIAIGTFTIAICIGIYYVLCRPGETLVNKKLSTWALGL